jgi:hypothetical protein
LASLADAWAIVKIGSVDETAYRLGFVDGYHGAHRRSHAEAEAVVAASFDDDSFRAYVAGYARGAADAVVDHPAQSRSDGGSSHVQGAEASEAWTLDAERGRIDGETQRRHGLVFPSAVMPYLYTPYGHAFATAYYSAPASGGEAPAVASPSVAEPAPHHVEGAETVPTVSSAVDKVVVERPDAGPAEVAYRKFMEELKQRKSIPQPDYDRVFAQGEELKRKAVEERAQWWTARQKAGQ